MHADGSTAEAAEALRTNPRRVVADRNDVAIHTEVEKTARTDAARRAGMDIVDPAATAAERLGEKGHGASAIDANASGLIDADRSAVTDILALQRKVHGTKIAEHRAATAADRLDHQPVAARARCDDVAAVTDDDIAAVAARPIGAAERQRERFQPAGAKLAAPGTDRLDQHGRRMIAHGPNAACETDVDQPAIVAVASRSADRNRRPRHCGGAR